MPDDNYLDWYYFDENRWHGPVSVNELKSLYFGKEIFETTKVVEQSRLTSRTLDDVRENNAIAKNLEDCDFYRETIAKLNLLLNEELDDDTWCSKKSPLVPILGYAALVFLIFYIAYRFLPESFFQFELSDSKIVYLISLSVYLGFWLTYFSSHKDGWFLDVPTLRRMLTASSHQWGCKENKEGLVDDPTSVKHQLEESYRDKARASMTIIAIMIAGSLILLVQTNQYLLQRTDILSLPFGWENTFLALAALSSFIAFISFLLSVDALDSMFNRFLTDNIQLRLNRRFYRFTLNPKYMGLIFLVLGITCFAAIQSGLIASIMLWITMSLGYYHWFPHHATLDDLSSKGGGEATPSLWKRILYSEFADDRLRLIIRIPLFGVFIPCAIYAYLVPWT